MKNIILLLCLLSLLPTSSAQAKTRVWLCDCMNFKATVTITEKYFELVHHTKSEVGDFVWQRVNYKEIAGGSTEPRYVEKVEAADYVKISQLKENYIDGVQYFTFESASLWPSTMVLVTAQNTHYSLCIKQPVKGKRE